MAEACILYKQPVQSAFVAAIFPISEILILFSGGGTLQAGLIELSGSVGPLWGYPRGT